MDEVRKLKRIRADLSNQAAEVHKLGGMEQQILNDMKKDFGVGSVALADKKLNTLEMELEEQEELLKDFVEKMERTIDSDD